MNLIFLKFTKVHGHDHPHLQSALENYSQLLQAMEVPKDVRMEKVLDLALKAGWKKEDWLEKISQLFNENLPPANDQ